MKEFQAADLMDEGAYWDIVERSKMNAVDDPSQLTNLVEILSKFTQEEIIKFDLRTNQLLFQAHTSSLWCAATIMNDRWISDNSFIYFKTWLISRGKDNYYNALTDPDTLVSQLDPNRKFYDFEEFRYGPSFAYEKVTGEPYHKVPYPKNFPYHESQYPRVSFSWQTENPRDMKKVCPQLYNAVYHPPRQNSPRQQNKRKR